MSIGTTTKTTPTPTITTIVTTIILAIGGIFILYIMTMTPKTTARHDYCDNDDKVHEDDDKYVLKYRPYEPKATIYGPIGKY